MYKNDEQNNHDSQRDALEARIKKIDEQIALLNTIKNQSLAKLQSFSQITPQQIDPVVNNQTFEDKVALFKSYFRGRDDVYAKLWINNKTGKRGYSPVCKHEWDSALCRKPAIKCSECPNQGFLSPDEIAIKQHLTSTQVMGVYPIITNANYQIHESYQNAENYSIITMTNYLKRYSPGSDLSKVISGIAHRQTEQQNEISRQFIQQALQERRRF